MHLTVLNVNNRGPCFGLIAHRAQCRYLQNILRCFVWDDDDDIVVPCPCSEAVVDQSLFRKREVARIVVALVTSHRAS